MVRSFIRRNIHSPHTFVSRIDEDDEMFLFDLRAHKGDRRRTAIGYYTIGSRILGAIETRSAHSPGDEFVSLFCPGV